MVVPVVVRAPDNLRTIVRGGVTQVDPPSLDIQWTSVEGGRGGGSPKGVF
eukprot:SAG22_NODE_2907_length_2113_cov_2.397219_2_plen_50_part_00